MLEEFNHLTQFFWDVDTAALSWESHQDFIIRRIIQYGDIASVNWLRRKLGDGNLRDWIIASHGRALTPRQIRYFSLILHIRNSLADQWIKALENSVWDRRRW